MIIFINLARNTDSTIWLANTITFVLFTFELLYFDFLILSNYCIINYDLIL